MPLRLILLTTLLIGATPARAQTQPAASPSDAPVAELPAPQRWSAEEVRRWAADHAATAELLETERAAVVAAADRDDGAACRRASLMQAVLSELAMHQRNSAAADAMVLYYQIVGAEQQQELLDEADEILQTLIGLAQRASELGLPDGDDNALRRQQLEIRDLSVQAEHGSWKLRRRLAQLTGRSAQQASTAVLVDSLVDESSAAEPLTAEPLTAEPLTAEPLHGTSLTQEATQAVETALARRHDLKAIRALCRRTSEETLSVTRQLLSGMQPGLGIGLGSAAALKIGLLAHHLDRSSGKESAWRCRQCQQLLRARTEQIRSEVEVAAGDLRAARRRVELAAEKSELADEAAEQQAQAVQIDEAPIGADRRAELEAIEVEGEYVERQVERAVAEVRLREAQGILAD